VLSVLFFFFFSVVWLVFVVVLFFLFHIHPTPPHPTPPRGRRGTHARTQDGVAWRGVAWRGVPGEGTSRESRRVGRSLGGWENGKKPTNYSAGGASFGGGRLVLVLVLVGRISFARSH